MIQELDLKGSVKHKLSNDKFSQIIGYIPILTVVIYYLLTKEWKHSNPVGFIVIAALVLVEQLLLFLPATKNNENIASGGIAPIAVYNIALLLGYVFYIPLYGPFVLIMPSVIFLTVYFRGIYSVALSGAVVIATVTLYTLKNGLPHEAYSSYYPYVIIVLGITFAALVNRSGAIDSKIRTDLVKASDRVSEESEQLNSLINGINDSVIATDENGNVIFFNSPSLKMFSVDEIKIGEPFSKFARLYDNKSNLVDFFTMLSANSNQQIINDLHLINTNNETVNISIDVSRVNSIYNDKDRQGVIFLIRDVTKEKSLDEQRDEFAAVTSHELRTPIATAEANISLAMDKRFTKNLDPEASSRLESAHQSVLYLADLVNQLSELSSIESVDQKVTYENIEVGKMFNQLYNDVISDVTKKGLALNLNVDPSAAQIYTSKVYVYEIIENFLTNAVKYTQSGSIDIKAVPTQDQKGGIIFSVADTGDGIASADKNKIFHKFYRAEDYKTMQTRGTGLGLYLTLKIAKFIDGKIWFSSDLGKGSTFYLQVYPIQKTNTQTSPVTTIT